MSWKVHCLGEIFCAFHACPFLSIKVTFLALPEFLQPSLSFCPTVRLSFSLPFWYTITTHAKGPLESEHQQLLYLQMTQTTPKSPFGNWSQSVFICIQYISTFQRQHCFPLQPIMTFRNKEIWHYLHIGLCALDNDTFTVSLCCGRNDTTFE